jgi:type III secretion protein L
VKIVIDTPGGGSAMTETAVRSASQEQKVSADALEAQKQLYQDACQTVQAVAAQLNELYRELFRSHHEAIARLSVEIARKVVMRNVSDGDYEIESIIKEALKNVPENSDTVVRLNPKDLADFRTLQDTDPAAFSKIKLVADETIGQAECVVENSKGIIKLLIDEHLEQISKAIVKTG